MTWSTAPGLPCAPTLYRHAPRLCPRQRGTDIDHHVDLRRTRGDGQPRLAGLDLTDVLAGREPATAARCRPAGQRGAAMSIIEGDTHTA